MSRPVCAFPSTDEGLQLHQRLGRDEQLATAAICQAFLPGLLGYLEGRFPDEDSDVRQEAAHIALLDYLKSPQRFRPEEGDLGSYLCLAARCDLSNLRRREARHHRHRVSLFSVEMDEEGGNLYGRDDEPLDQLTRAEDVAALQERLHDFEADCTPEERCILRLMIAQEDDTATCAAALGIQDLDEDEQARLVKRIKDRLKKRLERRRSA
jgi:hypothetical protein